MQKKEPLSSMAAKIIKKKINGKHCNRWIRLNIPEPTYQTKSGKELYGSTYGAA